MRGISYQLLATRIISGHLERDSGNQVTCSHGGTPVQHHLSATKAVDQKETGHGAAEVDCSVDTSHETGTLLAEPDRLLEEGGEIVA